jgi:periplasmic divalent cation tolerance protein
MASTASGSAVVCLVTTPHDRAREIASALLEQKLVACVNILESVQSLYWWEGKIEQDEEALLVVKTTREALAGIDTLLAKIHPYENFELVALDVVDGSRSYLEWIAKSVAPT